MVRIERDAELIDALRKHDAGSAEALVTAYGDRAYRLAVGITGNGSDAEEVVQDAFWAVVRKIESFRGESAFGSWLYRIVANAAYQKLRGGRARRQDCSLEAIASIVDEHGAPVEDWSGQLEDPALQADLRMVLTAALDSLPEEYRALVVLRDIEGLSTGEIGVITGLSVASVKSRTHRARLVLRKRLGEYFRDQPATAYARASRHTVRLEELAV